MQEQNCKGKFNTWNNHDNKNYLNSGWQNAHIQIYTIRRGIIRK